MLLDEAENRVKLNRKYLIETLEPKSNIDKDKSQKKKQKQLYDNSIKQAMIQRKRRRTLGSCALLLKLLLLAPGFVLASR